MLAKYMKYGKLVKDNQSGTVYRLIADMDEMSVSVKAENLEAWERYNLLSAWMRNWDNDSRFRKRFTGNIKKCGKERARYEEEIRICDAFPVNKVRFITADGKIKFTVDDLTVILVNGIRALVVYLDETHFTFGTRIETNLYGGCFHIDQFAGICDIHSVTLQLMEPADNGMTVYTDKLNADRYRDFVKCTNCGKLQLTSLGVESCGECKGNHLMWADGEQQECGIDTLVRQGYKVLHA